MKQQTRPTLDAPALTRLAKVKLHVPADHRNLEARAHQVTVVRMPGWFRNQQTQKTTLPMQNSVCKARRARSHFSSDIQPGGS